MTIRTGAPAAAGGERQAGFAQGLPLVVQAALPTMGAILLVPVVPLIAAEYGRLPGAAYLIPMLLTIPGLCIALFSVPAGFLGDRVGRRAPLIAALAIYGVMGMAPMVLGDIRAVLAARFVLGMTEAVIITLSATMLADYFTGATRDRWLASISAIASLSAVAFLLAAGQIGAAWGWRAVTAVYGLSLLIVPAMMFLTWEPDSRREQAAATAAGRVAFPWRHMAGTGAVTLFGSVLFYTLAIQQSMGLAELGLTDPGRIGALSAIATLANPLGTLLFWRVAHLRPSTLLAGEFLLLGAAFVGMSQATTDVQFTAATFAGSFAAGMLLPTLLTWTMRGLPFVVRARGTGIWQTLFALGLFLSGLLVPFLARNLVDGVLPAFGAIGIAAIAAAIAAAALRLASRSSDGGPRPGG